MKSKGIRVATTTRLLRTGGLAATAAALALGLSACQQHAPGALGATESAAAQVKPSETKTSASSSNASGANTKTPAGAVTSWVTQVLQEHYTEACMASAPVADVGSDPETACKSDDVKQALKSLHEAWAKPGIKLPPQGKVEVGKVNTTGDDGTVSDTAIKLDGKTLREIELIDSSGDTSSFHLDLKVQKKDGNWYVAGMNMGA